MYRARSALRHGQMSEAFSTMVFLTLSGGLQDAYTYCVRGQVFANAQTGNIVLMSQRAFAGDLAGVLRYLIPLLAFALGVFAAEMVRRRCQEISRLHWRQMVVLAEIGLLLGVGFLPSSWDAPANALVSFTCAMQVQAFRKVNGSAYASTMCIGNLRSGVDAFCAYWDTRTGPPCGRPPLLRRHPLLPWGPDSRRCLPALGNRGHLGQLSAAGRQFSSDVPAGDPSGSGLLRMRGTASIRISHQ